MELEQIGDLQKHDPMVSVVMPTYQHAPFIGQSIESILSQKTNFKVEILVGEDDSTDGTRVICQRIANEYPDRVRLVLRERKDVMYIGGQATGRANLLDLLGRAKGKYIALCEGDDHWIDPLKLQKQVDLLEADPKAVGCFTDVFNEKEGVRTPFFDGINYRVPQGITTERDLIYGAGIPTCSLVYRRDAMLEPIEQLYHSPVGDTIIFLHLSGSGHFIYLSESTAVRNVHAGGIFSMRKRSHQLKVRLTLLPMMNEMTQGRYADEINRKVRNARLELWQVAIGSGDSKLIQESWQAVMQDRNMAGWNRTTAVRNWFKAYVPIIEAVFSKIRD